MPLTWTTHVTVSCTSSDSSTTGQPARATHGSWPSSDHMSSAAYGANRLSTTATASVASRTAGSAGPTPGESIALRVALTSSMRRATATLKRYASTCWPISWTVRCVTARRAPSPVAGSAPGSEVTSRASRHARPRNFADPDGETSAQSMSSSGGPANAIVRRTASTPCSSSWSDRRTMLPLDLLIAEPSMRTMPWFSNRANGSSKGRYPMSCSTLVMNRAYSRCRIAWVTPPTYWSMGPHCAMRSLSKGWVSSFGETNRRKYQDESTNVSMVSGSRRAGVPSTGLGTFTHSSAAPRGDVPLGVRFSPSLGGSSTGSWSSGTGTSPVAVCTTGIGVPQYRWREISQSRSR